MSRSNRRTMSLIVLVVAVLTLAFIFSALPDIEEIDYLIGEMAEAMEIHEWYVENDYYPEFTGSVDWHIRWVDTYNRTISMLMSYRAVMWWIR